MNEWPFLALSGAPIEIIDGDRGLNYPHQHEFAPFGHCLFLNAGNVTAAGFSFSNCAFVTKEKDASLRKGKLTRNDVVLTTRGTVGNVAFFNAAVPYENMRINSGMVILRAQRPAIDPLFLYLFVRSKLFLTQVSALQTGSAQPQLPIKDIYRIEIPIPPPETQSAIASILGALDDKIDLNRRMNETLEAMARAIFKDWFVDFGPTRAKMEGRTPYLAPEIWELFPDQLDEESKPKGWQRQSVLEQADWINGAAFKNMHFVGAQYGLPVVKIAELKNGITSQTQFTNSDLGDRYRINDGEMLFSWSGNPDTSIDTFIWTGGPAWLNQHIFAIRENGRRTVAYLYSLLKWLNPVFAELARNKQTTGLGHVTKDDLKRLQIVAPSSAAEIAFNNVVEPILERIRGTLLESRTLAATRDLLLPKLMSGEIRVKDAEKAVEAVA
jgi:type I restriction enzyme, S subunit